MKSVWIIFNTSEYNEADSPELAIQAVFSQEAAAKKVFGLLSKIDAETPPAQEMFHGGFLLKEFRVGTRAPDFKKLWDLDFADMKRSMRGHPSFHLIQELEKG